MMIAHSFDSFAPRTAVWWDNDRSSGEDNLGQSFNIFPLNGRGFFHNFDRLEPSRLCVLFDIELNLPQERRSILPSAIAVDNKSHIAKKGRDVKILSDEA